MKVLLDNLASISTKDATYDVPTASLKALKDYFPSGETAPYYRYTGSLTTPACYESVKWSVLRSPIKITAAQVNLIKL